MQVTNLAAVPAFAVVITDDLAAAAPLPLSYVVGSATLNGSAAGVSVAGSLITADYSGAQGPLDPGGSVVLRFRATLAANLAIGDTVTNVGVVTWNTPQQTASASASVDVGGTPGAGALNGTVWHDADFDRAVGAETLLGGWSVELYRNVVLVQSVLTAADGTWRISGLAPNDATGDRYALRFRAPGAGANTAALGMAHSPFTNGMQQISGIAVGSGSNLQNLNLPIDPNGVVYGALDRAPILRCDADPARSGLRNRPAFELLRRSGAAGPGDARPFHD